MADFKNIFDSFLSPSFHLDRAFAEKVGLESFLQEQQPLIYFKGLSSVFSNDLGEFFLAFNRCLANIRYLIFSRFPEVSVRDFSSSGFSSKGRCVSHSIDFYPLYSSKPSPQEGIFDVSFFIFCFTIRTADKIRKVYGKFNPVSAFESRYLRAYYTLYRAPLPPISPLNVKLNSLRREPDYSNTECIRDIILHSPAFRRSYPMTVSGFYGEYTPEDPKRRLNFGKDSFSTLELLQILEFLTKALYDDYEKLENLFLLVN